jgi:hypothetical protein
MSHHAINDARTLRRAIKAASKKIRLLGNRLLNANLECCCGDMAEAYQVGVEEAQGEIISRLMELQAKVSNAACRGAMSRPLSGSTPEGGPVTDGGSAHG